MALVRLLRSCASFLAVLAPASIAAHTTGTSPLPADTSTPRPNIIFILTDDQDLHMDSLSYMPYLKKHIVEHGTTFNKHYCTVALCCPSRVSLWTGRAAHNTNVTDVNPPYGGYPKFVSQGLNSAYLPVWLQSLDYATYYVGKLFNAHSVDNYASPRAAGWTGSEFLLDPYTYEYLNATFVRNHEEPKSYEGQYSTDVLATKAMGFLNTALHEYKQHGKPFFLTVAPTAPHSNLHMNTQVDGNFSERSNTQSPPVPAPRHAHLFEDVRVPRTPHFNPSDEHGVAWIAQLPQQNESNIDFNDHFYRSRLRALQAVDETIDALFLALEAAGVTEETYVFFSTDNGYHIGQHRLQPGKQCPFEEDVNIPFIVRGPGITKNTSTNIVTTHTDLAPTFLNLAGGELRNDFDGQVIPLRGMSQAIGDDDGDDDNTSSLSQQEEIGTSVNADARDWITEHVNIESWGVIMSEGNFGSILYPNHTYKALRILGEGYSFLYTVWCSGEHELYDLLKDPYAMENLHPTNHSSTLIDFRLSGNEEHTSSHGTHSVTIQGFESLQWPLMPASRHAPESISVEQLLTRLDALLMVLKTCKARACTHPWGVLHPAKDVKGLREAMAVEYDEFYAGQQRVAYAKCEKGYIIESEGPAMVEPYAFDVGA